MAEANSTGSGKYRRTAAQLRKIRLFLGFMVVILVVAGYFFWHRQAQSAGQVEKTATLTPVTVTVTSQPTKAKAVEEILPSPTPTIHETQVSLEPINWVSLSSSGVAIPTNYMVSGTCSTLPTGWILSTPDGEKEFCENAEQNLGDDLTLPTGAAVIPGYKLPETRYTQTAAMGDDLEMPWEVPGADDYWLRYKDTPEKLVRVCLLQDNNEVTDTRSFELVVDENLNYKPTGAGECVTTLDEDSNLVVFSFLNEVYKAIERGDYKYYEVVLDLTIQGGVNQELWLGGKSLSNN